MPFFKWEQQMIEIAIQEIANYDLKNLQEQMTLNINGDKYLLNPTLNGRQYILTLVNDEMELPKKKRKAGSAKGLIRIADDFDEPLDCLKEYM